MQQLTICECIVSDVITRTVKKDKDQGKDCSGLLFGGHITLHWDSPGDVAADQTASARKVHPAARIAWRYQRTADSREKGPAGDPDVNFRLDNTVRNTNKI